MDRLRTSQRTLALPNARARGDRRRPQRWVGDLAHVVRACLSLLHRQPSADVGQESKRQRRQATATVAQRKQHAGALQPCERGGYEYAANARCACSSLNTISFSTIEYPTSSSLSMMGMQQLMSCSVPSGRPTAVV